MTNTEREIRKIVMAFEPWQQRCLAEAIRRYVREKDEEAMSDLEKLFGHVEAIIASYMRGD